MRPPRRKGRGTRRRNVRNAAGVAMLSIVVAGLLLGSLAGQLLRSQEQAQQIVLDRYTARAALSQNFVEAYIRDLQRRIRVLGEATLSGPSPTAADLDTASQVLEFKATVLLDGTGHLLQVFPDKPALIGQEMTAKYAHLEQAVAGQTAISSVVPSAATGQPIVAFAVPFTTPYGPRVLSGGFDVSDTPLGAFLTNSSTIAGSSVHIVEAAGNIVSANDPTDRGPLVDHDPELARAMADAPADVTAGTFSQGGIPSYYTARSIAGTPWRIVYAAPIDGLFASISTGQSGPWTMFAGFAAAACLIIVLMTRVVFQRGDYANAAEADALTGVANRRQLDRLVRELGAKDDPFGLLMIDIDHFKHVNDRLGHQGGDAVLCRVASLIDHTIRPTDTVGRWGGEEFMVLLPGADLDGCLLVAERVRQAVAGAQLTGDDIGVTISLGAAASEVMADAPSGSTTTLATVPIEDRADAALYRAKHDGRNQVVAG